MLKSIKKRWPKYFEIAYMIEKQKKTVLSKKHVWHNFEDGGWYSDGYQTNLDKYCCRDRSKVEKVVFADEDKDLCIIHVIQRSVDVISSYTLRTERDDQPVEEK